MILIGQTFIRGLVENNATGRSTFDNLTFISSIIEFMVLIIMDISYPHLMGIFMK